MFTYVILDFASLMGYAIVAEKVVKWLKTNPRTINSISACVLIIIAIIIALTQNY
jgi:threonine/homoserine/homoserine lactone efflux protein